MIRAFAAPLLALLIAAASPPSVVVPAPGAPWSPAEVAALRADLGVLLRTAPAVRGAHVGALVAVPGGGPVLFAHSADDAFQPASALKLLVGSVALSVLGPNYRFTTELVRTPGGLALRGGGDPTLREADLADAAEAAAAAGVTGPVDLLIDASHVAPGERRPPGWSVDDELTYYAPAITGLPVEGNVLHVTLRGGVPGSVPELEVPAPLRALPPGEPCRPGPTRLAARVAARVGAAGAENDLDVARGRCGEFVVTGTVAADAAAAIDVAVDEPEALAFDDLAGELERRGIGVRPAPTSGPVAGVTDDPPAAGGGIAVWTHRSVPLAELLGVPFWQPSDNFVGELLLRELDAATAHRPGTAAGGIALEREWLRRAGGDPATVSLADGSGLSQYDRITPRALMAVLAADWDAPARAAVLDALPIAGVRGSLRGAMLGTVAAGRTFAKTGSMSHVRSLAGYVATRGHGAVAFVLMLDDWLGTEDEDDALRAAFCERLASA